MKAALKILLEEKMIMRQAEAFHVPGKENIDYFTSNISKHI